MCNPSTGGKPDDEKEVKQEDQAMKQDKEAQPEDQTGENKKKAEKKLDPEDQSDPTLNKILKAADANMFGLLNSGDVWSGVYIRNLFTLRSPYPKKVEEAFKKEMENFKKEKGAEKKKYLEACNNDNDEASREYALSKLQVGSNLDEWKETAENCEKVIVAWGNCGDDLEEIKWAKQKVIFAL